MTLAAAPVLSASGLAVSRAGRTVLQGIDFGLAPGGLLQVLGANGSGKTTLLRVLCGLASADAGTLQWHGRPLRAADPEFQQALAYLGHANGIDIDLTPAENLRFAARLIGHHAGRHADAGERAASVARALAAQGLERVAHVPVRTLSQGQRRRVALARLALAPRTLWLLDEPVTALDADSCARFQRQLDAHLAAGGMAVIATHQLLPGGGAVLRLDGAGA
ncbi:heme export protein (ABC superfamily, atp_bind), cytochrome c-type biogenesis [Cupriavidus taiwanensis]|uniref:cytochrome c biogenesis heme-transporting ATPase CcmA n=1 Tax=Cupriavidus taiwanensis TaxID=164546 RepID=UPI000E1041D7|nr:cytochrome c biogenesis heme-transporting ATPase CcmA [Cupriavidus taiwanensis]SPA42144.1 heme export protein (ABC superfamily, atp_bind), cytochrome c-type biogenesis [Cupriavidus taiwanensis]